MDQIQSAGIVIYRYNQYNIREYLLLHYVAGHWDFCKGKVDKGESLIEAAYRELKEETNLKVQVNQNFCSSFEYNFVNYHGQIAHKKVYFFLGQIKENSDIILSHEHIDFVWLSYKDALKKITYDNAKQLLKKVESFLSIQK